MRVQIGETVIGQAQSTPIIFRLTLAVLTGLVGLVFPWLFILTGLIVWGVVEELRHPVPRSDNPWNHAYDAEAHDADWKQRYLALCESPAESAFLSQMIAAFHLTPNKGLLVNSGIKVELQAQKLKYRLDFLVNTHHGIEVDGAEYHSSEYDRGMDAFRDAELSQQGIKVLRLPAKLVLNNADEVIRQVRAFLRDSAPAVPKPLPERPKSRVERMLEDLQKREDAYRERSLKEQREMPRRKLERETDRDSEFDDDLPF